MDMTDKHPSQYLALAIGAVYTVIGVVGFFITGFENFAGDTGHTLLGFAINPLHNIVHLVIGIAGLALWARLDTARLYGWILAIGYGAAFVYGLVAVGNADLNYLNINNADNVLHIVSALAGLVVALLPADVGARGSTAGRRA